MIVRMINDDGIWIPTPKLFLNILDNTGLKLASEKDKDNIINKLNQETTIDHGVWDFNIRLRFNVYCSDGNVVPCSVRIIKSRKDDNCTACIVFRSKSDRLTIKDFDYKFGKEDL